LFRRCHQGSLYLAFVLFVFWIRRDLDLSYNSLSGPLPGGRIGFTRTIRRINLQNNEFDGSIPEGIGFFGHLLELRLDNNLFTGTIPRSFANLADLSWVMLSPPPSDPASIAV
jgi:hypothetical protein